ncbi:MAG: hypothetical protein QM727_04385 [Niabella sp.]
MKKFILLAAVAVTFSLSAMAATSDPIGNEKVEKTFNELFKGAQNVQWYNSGKYIMAHFVTGDVRTRVRLDEEGKLLQTIRYYGESELPTHIVASLKENFSGKNVWGITEVSNEKGIVYHIVLKDAKHWYNVISNADGEMNLSKKFKRGDK